MEPPEYPAHVVAQQLLALVLQEGQVGENTWRERWAGLPFMDVDADEVLAHLRAERLLVDDGGLLSVGPELERRYGRRHFMDLVAVFLAPPEFRVLHGRREVGTVDVLALTTRVEGPRVLLLGGRTWKVTHVDWSRRQVFVEEAEGRGRARWQSQPAPLSFALCRAMREVVLGADPPVGLTGRAVRALRGGAGGALGAGGDDGDRGRAAARRRRDLVDLGRRACECDPAGEPAGRRRPAAATGQPGGSARARSQLDRLARRARCWCGPRWTTTRCSGSSSATSCRWSAPARSSPDGSSTRRPRTCSPTSGPRPMP